MESKKYVVRRIGWEKENKINIILINRQERYNMLLETGAIVKVKNVTTNATTFAIVERQFRDLISTSNACTVNQALKTELNLNEGNEVQITKEVTESEAEAFRQKCTEIAREEFMNSRNSFFQALRAMATQ